MLRRSSSIKCDGKPDEKSASSNPFARNTAPAPSQQTQAPQINIGEAPPAYSANAPSNDHTSSGLQAFHLGRSASPAPSTASRASRISMASITNDDDKYAFLATFDTVFLIDDSGSMAGSNWREARDVLSRISEICTERDKDGIDIYFLNHKTSARGGLGQADGGYYNIKSPAQVQRIFDESRPMGVTPTGKRLRSILKPYTDMLERSPDVDDVKPVNIIVITDGAPTDDPESSIIQAAKKLDRLDAPTYQVGIQFFQVGNSPSARDALKQLDDGLEELGVRDIVDTATWDGPGGVLTVDGILKVVLGAVVRRLDRQSREFTRS
ncbi:hypothetical protein ACO1O0_004373 [Amphichorda felina]